MNPLQKAAARRKVAYLAAILGLFTLSIFYRGLEAKPADGAAHVWVPFGRDDRAGGVPDRAARGTILSQARRLELRELEQGDPEVAGLTARLALTGTRGFAVAALWYAAIDKQKRNDFHEFEKLVQAVTALQPHFITPWIFQSWNIAYNVSVEMQSLGDMYFYIARGIDLLAEGERRNRRSPDMRYQIAFYYQNKFGVSDQVQTLRCLFQLSCIPPGERDPDALLTLDKAEVDPAQFRQFCEKHPHLVRRLRGEERYDKEKSKKTASDTLRAKTPMEVVEFLRANRKVPARYKSADELAEAVKQFPALPPKFNTGPDEAHPGLGFAELGDGFTGFGAARAWFTYANDLIPPHPRDEAGNPVPWSTPRPGAGWGEYDPKQYRVPRLPMLIIFRQGPARAQTYQADMEQKDGWYDADGWALDAGIDPSALWFPAALKAPVVKAAGPSAGETVYTVPVENAGAVSASGVGLTVTLPGWAEVARAEPAASATAAGADGRAVLTWALGDLPRGQKREVRLTVRRKPGATADDPADPTAAATAGGQEAVVVGGGQAWSQAAWEAAAGLWRRHGEDNALILTDAQRDNLRREAKLEPGVPDPPGLLPELTPAQKADPDIFRQHRATSALFLYNQNRQVTNFPFYLASAEAEKLPDTVRARKLLWQAEQARRVADKLKAADLYKQGLVAWRGVLLANPDFHRPDRFDAVEEQTYEYELDYLRLIAQDDPAVREKARQEYAAELARVGLLLPVAAGVPAVIPEAQRADRYAAAAERYFSPLAEPMPAEASGGRGGTPWVRDQIKDAVLVRQGIPRPAMGASGPIVRGASGRPAAGPE